MFYRIDRKEAVDRWRR